MVVAPGARLGVYDITAQIGEGGMGQVYRATDTRLKRPVAIKILPPSLASDLDRLARFQREAEVLASLNHPHIAGIYGLEESDGVSALVMELVEGEDLSQRIGRGAIPLDEALPIAKQIAEALEAAHELGIVHRDLKPANIMVRSDGTVKVLDFGLAKATDAAGGAAANAMNSPTLTAATMHGVILGTAGYMSPEQARGKTVDKRADIWAFGVVVFEMLSGRSLYTGETVTDVIAGIVTSEPDWGRLPTATPEALRRLLARCLDKDPLRRLRDIGEARLGLERIAQKPVDEHEATASAPASARRGCLVAVTAVLAAAAAFAAVRLFNAGDRVPGSPVRLEVTLPVGVTIPVNFYNVLAISRDGSRLAVVGVRDGVSRIYLRTLRDFEVRPLAGTEGATEPFFSPDGAWIGFLANSTSLKKISVDGGLVVTIAPAGSIRGAVWNDADDIIFPASGTTPLSSIPAGGGAPRSLTTLNAQQHERTHRLPSLLPDGKTVLFNVGTFANPEDYDDATIEALRLDTGERKVVMQGGRMPTYSASGDLLYVRGNVLYAVSFDPRRLEVRGRARPIIDGVLGDPTTGASFFAVSDSGTLAYVPGTPSPSARQLAWAEPGGKTTPIDLPPAQYTDLHVSSDGMRLAFSIVVEGSRSRDIWVADPARGTSSRLTSQGTNWTPLWSPDARRLFSVSYDGEKNRSSIEVRAGDGSGDVTRIGAFDGVAFLEDITRDEKTLFVRGRPTSGAPWHIYRLGTAGSADSAPVEVPIPVRKSIWKFSISPDGRWSSYVTGGDQNQDVYVQSMEAGGGRVQVTQDSFGEPLWSADGRELYVISDADELMAVPLGAGRAPTPGRPRQLSITLLRTSIETSQNYAVDPKRGRVLVMRAASAATVVPQVRIMLNAFADARLGPR